MMVKEMMKWVNLKRAQNDGVFGGAESWRKMVAAHSAEGSSRK
jgi:hypothetical protein